MALKFEYYGQNVGWTVPDVALTGDPSVDQPVLAAAGYKGGRIMALTTSATPGRGVVVVPCDGASMNAFGTLINGGGEYATSIGPSGSKKAPVVRAMWTGTVDAEAYEASPAAPYTIGAKLYAGTGGVIGQYTTTANGLVVGLCTHIPTVAEPWLGVASLL